MRRLLIALAVIGLWFIGGLADAAECSSIRGGDERAFCRAVATGQKGQCAAIRSFDKRQACYVRLGSPASYCASVSPGWPRKSCHEQTRLR